MRGREQGFALLIVLWSVVLLSLLATGITSSGRTDLQLASNLRAAARAEAAADGAVYEAAFHLLDPAAPWAAAGQPHILESAAVTVEVRIDDEAGKINPNTASPELLRALLHAVGADARTSDALPVAIVDWRFPSSNTRPGAAKAPAYRAAGLAYAPPGAPFESLDELGAVLGMTPVLLARLAPHLSIYNDRDPSPHTTDLVVQQALKEVYGPLPDQVGRGPPLRTVTVSASAQTAEGARFLRRATLRLRAGPRDAPIEVLTWEVGGERRAE